MMLAPSRWHINGYTWDPNGPLASQDQHWPDIMIVTAGVKHVFPQVITAVSIQLTLGGAVSQGHCQPQDHLEGCKAASESRSGSE